MRYFFVLLLFGCGSLFAADDVVVEPATKVRFAPALKTETTSLVCTGTSVRKVYGFDIYAIAHYGDPAAAPDAGATPEDKLAHWVSNSKAKAMIIEFVFHADEQNMRQFAGKSLDDAGYVGEKRDHFLDAFAQDYESGNQARLIAEGSVLKVEINGEAKGSWDDADLVRALWQCWLGEKSVLKDRKGLVSLSKQPSETVPNEKP